ncbi:MAG: glycosyltransferase [Armatimonadota bacterium]
MNPPNALKVSVIVCTWNRCETVLRCLRSLEAQTCPKDCYEVVVVDNNSTDDTPAAVSDLASRSDMSVRYVREDRQGLSHARNTGIEAARGEVLAFIDDDCTAEPGYVQAILEVFEDATVDAAAGKVTCVLPRDLVTDLPQGFDAARKVAHLDLGPQRRRMEPHEYALGCNLIVRKVPAVSVGCFRTDMGYAGESKVVGEDTDFWDRLRAAGASMFWEPRAAVLHRVGPERFSKTAFRKAAYCYGQGSAIRRLGTRCGAARRAGAVLRFSVQAGLNAIVWPLVSWSPKTRFEVELKMLEGLGKAAGALGRRDRVRRA